MFNDGSVKVPTPQTVEDLALRLHEIAHVQRKQVARGLEHVLGQIEAGELSAPR